MSDVYVTISTDQNVLAAQAAELAASFAFHPLPRRPRGNHERFWACVDVLEDQDACHLWTKSLEPSGYGRFFLYYNDIDPTHGGQNVNASRYALLGKDCFDPKYVRVMTRHSCHVRLCCNRRHLKLGTHLQNVRDSMNEDRLGRKLTREKVLLILHCVIAGRPMTHLAAYFGVTVMTIRDVCIGRTWSHVEEANELRAAVAQMRGWKVA